MKLLSILLFGFAFLDDSSFAEKQQHSMLRRQTDAIEIKESTYNVSFLERQMKSSNKKGSKTSKGTKSNKSSKSTKSNKTSKSSNDQDVSRPSVASTTSSVVPSATPSFSFAPTKSIVSILEDTISSVVENNDFSSYNQENFDVAKTWFLNPLNHPSDFRLNGDEYMKERFILALIYSANCNPFFGCILYKWRSTIDHCEWSGVFCNDSKEVFKLDMRDSALVGEFTLFGMKSLRSIRLNGNNLSGTFTVAGASPNLTNLLLSSNKLTGLVGGGMLTNLERIDLSSNELAGDFIANEGNLPISIKTLRLKSNKLTGFVGGGILTNLDFLRLSKNEFAGDFIITAENFPDSITFLDFRANDGLKSINAETDVVSQLEVLYVGTGIITVNQELCYRRPTLIISPNLNDYYFLDDDYYYLNDDYYPRDPCVPA